MTAETGLALDSTPQNLDKSKSKGSKKKKKGGVITLMIIVVWLFFLLFLILPLGSLLLVGITGEQVDILGAIFSSELRSNLFQALGGSSVSNVTDVLSKPAYSAATINSLKLSLLVATITTVISMPIAYGLARTKMPLKKLISVLCTMPVVVPTMVGAAGLIIMFGKSGWATMLWQKLGGEGVPFNVYSMTGIVIVMIFFLFPFVLWPMVAAFRVADGSIENASKSLGAKGIVSFLTATLPLAIPGIASAALLVFAIAFADFGAAIILAPAKLNLVVVQAYREVSGFFNWGGASILVMLMIAIVVIFFMLQRWVVKGRDYSTLTSKGSRIELNDSPILCRILTIYSLIVVLIPTLIILSVGLQSFARRWRDSILPNEWTLRHYKLVLGPGIDNITNTLILSSGALFLTVIFGAFIAYIVRRNNARGLDFISTLPLIVPGVALGIALILSFNAGPLALSGTALLLVFAYSIRRLPYMLRSVSGTMQAIGIEVEEAAGSLGASRLTTLWTIIFPLLRPGLLAGGVLVFSTVVKETSLSILLAPASWKPMSTRIFESLARGELFTASALSVILILLVLVLQQVANKISGGVESS
ncbi:MAG: ABC transporter permease [Canibacter sp.]